jgi:small subunit ribosomal protein S9
MSDRTIRKQVWKTGRRKRAHALAVVEAGSGVVRVNGVPIELLQPEAAQRTATVPLVFVGDLLKLVDVEVSVHGGGFMGQAYAVSIALARALTRWFDDCMPSDSQELRNRLKEYDEHLLKGDSRQKESKKPSRRRARAMPQKSYR